MRLGVSVAASLFVLAGISVGARADEATSPAPPTKQQCIDAYKSAQELSRASTLSKARAALLLCARDPCPAVLQKDCVEWLQDVTTRMPTIVAVLRDPKGRDLPNARLVIDGVEVSPRVDGRPVELDPGEHVVRIEPEGRPLLELQVVAREREKAREVVFDLPPTAAEIAADREAERKRQLAAERAMVRPLPWTFWVTTSIGAVALGSFTFFGVHGLSQRDALGGCKPNCSQDRIDAARTSFTVADVSLIVTGVAAAVSTVLYVTRPRVPAPIPRATTTGFMNFP